MSKPNEVKGEGPSSAGDQRKSFRGSRGSGARTPNSRSKGSLPVAAAEDEDPCQGLEACYEDQKKCGRKCQLRAKESVTSIMDTILLNTMLDRKAVVRSEAEAFVPLGPYVSPESRRKEFMAYLHSTGFLKAITTIIMTLYEETELPTPERCVEYIASSLGYSLTVPNAFHSNQQYLKEMQEKTAQVREYNDSLRRLLDDYEDADVPIDVVEPDSLPTFKYQKGYDPSGHTSTVNVKSKLTLF